MIDEVWDVLIVGEGERAEAAVRSATAVGRSAMAVPSFTSPLANQAGASDGTGPSLRLEGTPVIIATGQTVLAKQIVFTAALDPLNYCTI